MGDRVSSSGRVGSGRVTGQNVQARSRLWFEVIKAATTFRQSL